MFGNILTKFKRTVNKAAHKRKEGSQKVQSDYKNYSEVIPSSKKIDYKKSLIVIAVLLFITIIVVVVHISISVIQFNFKTFPGSITQPNIQSNEKIRTVLFTVLDRTDETHAFVDAISVLSYNLDTKKVSIFSINPDLKVYSTRLNKDLNIRTAFNEISSIENKTQYFKEGIESLLAIKIDNYVITDIKTFNDFSKLLAPININIDKNIKDLDTKNLPDKQYKEWNSGNIVLKGGDVLEFLASNNNGRDDQLNRESTVLKNFLLETFNIQNILNIPEILKIMKEEYFFTDLKKDEIINLAKGFLDIKNGNINTSYTKSISYYSIYAVSYYPIFSVNYNILDKEIADVFSDIDIFKEQARIEILNGSSIKGLASNRARWISNTGARIIKVGNSYESAKITTVYCDLPQKYPITLNAIQRIFNYKANIINKDYEQRHVGDIIVVIGDDY